MDAQFCQKICTNLNIQCHTLQLSAKDLSKTTNRHLSEDRLRELRYAYLTKFAIANNIHILLTAHTLDDQVETILFRLFRGTGLSGLKGIETHRQLDNDIYLFRPLLKLSKDQCQEFLKEEGIVFRHDSSNLNEIYNRNYIRHKILPVIKSRFPDLPQHLDSLTSIAQAEDDYFSKAGRFIS